MIRLFLPILFLFLVSDAHTADADKINIYVSILPQKYLVERIGGEHVNVSVMVGPGHSPETYEPTPKQMVGLSQSQIYFRIGVPFETAWMGAIGTVNKHIKVIDCCHEIATIGLSNQAAHKHNRHRSAMVDPHVWTSPANARYLAAQITQALIKEDPANQDDYLLNFQRLNEDLNALDSDIRSMLQRRRTPYVFVSHSSWAYFLKSYGLIQISLENNGKERGARGLAELISFAKKENIHTLFLQKQFKISSVQTFANEIDASLIEIDPLAENYIDNLRTVSRLIAEAIK